MSGVSLRDLRGDVAGLREEVHGDVRIVVLADPLRAPALLAPLHLEHVVGLGEKEIPLAGMLRLLAEQERGGLVAPREGGPDLEEVPGAAFASQVPG